MSRKITSISLQSLAGSALFGKTQFFFRHPVRSHQYHFFDHLYKWDLLDNHLNQNELLDNHLYQHDLLDNHQQPQKVDPVMSIGSCQCPCSPEFPVCVFGCWVYCWIVKQLKQDISFSKKNTFSLSFAFHPSGYSRLIWGMLVFFSPLFFNLTFAGGSSAVRQVWSKTSVHSLKMTFDPFSRTLNSFQPESRGIGDVDEV